jgi:hypothetical protein
MPGRPRNSTPILFVPAAGATLKVIVGPVTEYVLGFCIAPSTYAMTELVLAGAWDSVKELVPPVPLNWSKANAAVDGSAPM